MNENVNLTKILKNCPKGWEFYSSVYGKVKFIEITPIRPVPDRQKDDELFMAGVMMEREYPVKLNVNGFVYRVSSAGEHKKGVGECTLFPSREQRDWSKFEAPWYKKDRFDPTTLKPFDKVLVRDERLECWRCAFYSHQRKESTSFRYATTANSYARCIPYNDETKHLVGTTDKAPEYYRYWED